MLSVLAFVVAMQTPAPAAAPAPAPTPARISDRQTKELIEKINHERDRFEDQLDGGLKRSVLRTASNEVDVERFLDDLQNNVGRMKDRFTGDYGAGSEVKTVLVQGSAIQRFMATQPPSMKGASEWNQLASSLGQLASAYGADFPTAPDAAVRRITDREVVTAANQAAQAADRYKKMLDQSLKMDKTFSLADRQAAVKEAEELKREAKQVESRVKDNKPATGEVSQLLQRAQQIQTASAGLPLSPNAKAAWAGVMKPLETVAHGFNVPALN